tara:strand:- start:386 stop:664 length:279 start_codon:yes stop_codon:yes gene_type:complete
LNAIIVDDVHSVVFILSNLVHSIQNIDARVQRQVRQSCLLFAFRLAILVAEPLPVFERVFRLEVDRRRNAVVADPVHFVSEQFSQRAFTRLV